MNYEYWLLIVIGCLTVEISIPGFFFCLPFAAGATASFAVSLFAIEIVWQCMVFLGVTITSFAFLYYYKNQLLHKKIQHTNVSALIGATGYITKPITAYQPGYAMIGSEIWLAKSYDGSQLHEMMKVRVVSVHGAHVVVMAIE